MQRTTRWAKAGIPVLVCASLTSAAVACNQRNGGNGKTIFESANARPDVLPVMLNKDLPFRYPPALYAEKTQGNVTLRLYVDKNGGVVNDSTRVVETSGAAMLDTAAIKGSRELHFVPAKLRGVPMAVSILFPVYFRHPEAPPVPGDSALRQGAQPLPAASTKTPAR